MQKNRTIIYNFLNAWVKEGCIEKQDLKEISIQLEDKLKKRKKLPNPLFNPFNELLHKYAEKYQKQIFFTSRSGKSLNEIIEKLSVLAEKKNPNFTQQELLDGWEMILAHLPDFYLDSFDVVMINNKLDTILNQIRNAKRKQTGINTSEATGLLEHLRTRGNGNE